MSRGWFDTLLKELTEKFGGATSFIRASGEGLWESGSEKEKDSIAVIEVMAEGLRPTAYLAFAARKVWSGSYCRTRSLSGRRKSELL